MALLLAGPARSGTLDALLNPDGTVRAGAHGSFNAKGYRLETAPDGRPMFLKNADELPACLAPASTLVNGTDDPVHDLAVDGSGNVYVGGYFTTAGGVAANYVAKWNGSSWSALGTGLGGAGGDVRALAVDGSGNVYAGGTFSTAGGVAANNIAKWNGSSWSALGTGIGGGGDVRALAVDGSGNVYAGGNFSTAGGVAARNIAKWNGSSWSALGTGMNHIVSALAVDGSGNVYAGGTFSTAGGVAASNIAKWNGSSWSALGTGVGGGAGALAVDGSGNVYAGGNFSTAGGVAASNIAKWNGSNWSALGTGINNSGDALAVDGSGNVYAGGGFTTAGGAAARNIAKWNGSSWSAFGTGVGSGGDVRALAVDGSGNVYAGGYFSTAGGVAANNIARWNGSSWSALEASPPTLTAITPSSSTVGAVVALTGTNLNQATAIVFTGSVSNVVTTGFTVNSAGTQITNIAVPIGAMTGAVTVTTPNGVSNGIPFTVVPPALTAYHLQQPGVSTPRVDLHYQATGVVKVCADNAAGTLFSVARSGSQSLKLRIQENPNGNSTGTLAAAAGYINPQTQTTTATAVEAVYYHPAFVDVAGPQAYKSLHLELVDNATGIVLATYPVQAVRPPLLLVHGLWSTGDKAFPDLRTKLVTDGLYDREEDIRYANYSSDRGFTYPFNVRAFILHKNAQLKAYADRNISASKVDVIGHSMGGLQARQYIQSRDYNQDINKLITLNTPHSGSPIPNWINSLSPVARARLFTVLTSLGRDPTKGALDDLNWNKPGYGIALLNVAPINSRGVPVHAVTTTTTLPSGAILATQLLLVNGTFGFGGTLLGYMSLTRPPLGPAMNQFLADSMFQNAGGNDFIVGLDSQQGGLATPYTDNTTGQWHGSGGTLAVQNRLAALLRANSHGTTATTPSNLFTTAGFRPVTIRSAYQRLAAPPAAPPLAKTTSTLQITAPTRNQLLTDPDSIQVTVSASSDVTRVMLLCSAGTAELTTKLLTGAGGTAYIKVPKGGLGRLKLAALAFADSACVQYDTLGTRLTTNATLTGLRLEPRFVYTTPGDSAILQVSGTYSDGIDRNVLGQPGMQFTFRTGGKARMGRGSGYVVGTTIGRDSLRVTYAGRTDIVPVEVAAQAPVLATRVPIIQQLAVWPNPAQQLVHISGTSGVPIELLDLLGRAVRSHAPVKSSEEAIIDLRGLPAGIYIVRAGTATRRLLVE